MRSVATAVLIFVSTLIAFTGHATASTRPHAPLVYHRIVSPRLPPTRHADADYSVSAFDSTDHARQRSCLRFHPKTMPMRVIPSIAGPQPSPTCCSQYAENYAVTHRCRLSGYSSWLLPIEHDSGQCSLTRQGQRTMSVISPVFSPRSRAILLTKFAPRACLPPFDMAVVAT